MNRWNNFIDELEEIIDKNEGIEQIRKVLHHMNFYFYVQDESLGKTEALGEKMEYFSPHHKVWEENFEEILDFEMDEDVAYNIASVLIEVQREEGLLPVESGDKAPSPDLSAGEIARIRFFSANQDFKIDINSPYKIYKQHPELFNEEILSKDPGIRMELIDKLGAKSQYDKRTDYVKNSSKFLTEKGIEPYEIAEYYEYDATKIRDALINTSNMGYSEKKTDMFIRDMEDLGVWTNLENLSEIIDVASDVNTMKVALRTGLLKSSIPALSSFLDIFCHQYMFYDKMNARAWRTVWEKMKEIDEENAPPYAGALDFLVYNLGRTVCKPKVTIYECQNCGNRLKWNTARKRKCPSCGALELKKKNRFLPCEIDGFDNKNISRIRKKVPLDDNNCIFHDICSEKRKKLNPPESISIKGRTGWNSARTDKGGGGGLKS